MDSILEDDYDEDYSGGHQVFHFRSDGKSESEIREQDRYLPIANIARIMKKVLPGNAKIAKDAKESIQECVSEFISFITSEASDKCQQEKRKTINGDDLLWAMSTLGFEKYIDPLKAYLAKYRESVKGERVADKKPPIRRDMPSTSTIPFQNTMTQLKPAHGMMPSYQGHGGSTTILSISSAPTIKTESGATVLGSTGMIQQNSASQYKWNAIGNAAPMSLNPMSQPMMSVAAPTGHATRAQSATHQIGAAPATNATTAASATATGIAANATSATSLTSAAATTIPH